LQSSISGIEYKMGLLNRLSLRNKFLAAPLIGALTLLLPAARL